MSDLPTVRSIVAEYLVEHGYDGLAGEFLWGNCGCWTDDLMPCCTHEDYPYPCADCVPGHAGVVTEADEDSDYPPGTPVIVPGPRRTQ